MFVTIYVCNVCNGFIGGILYAQTLNVCCLHCLLWVEHELRLFIRGAEYGCDFNDK